MTKIDKALDVFAKRMLSLNENVLDYPRKTLAQDVWGKDKKIKPQIKKEILSTFEKWKSKMMPDAKVKNIYVLGSITTFQYNKTSDIDINIILDGTRADVGKVWKTLPNGNKIDEHPVNYYLSVDTKDIDKSKTLYDLENDNWVKEPKETDTIMPDKYSLEIARFFMDGVDMRLSEYNRDKTEYDRLIDLKKEKNSSFDEDELEEEIAKKDQEIKADLEAIRLAKYVIKSFRNEGFNDENENKFSFKIRVEPTNDPNKSLNNLIYKEMEKYGYLDKIKEVLGNE